MSQANDGQLVVAPGLREEVARALMKRDETRLRTITDQLDSSYAWSLIFLARDELATEVTADWSDAKIAELDNLVCGRISIFYRLQYSIVKFVLRYRIDHLFLILMFLVLTVITFTGNKSPVTYDAFVISALSWLPMLAIRLSRYSTDHSYGIFLDERRKLRRLKGKSNFLPYHAVRQAASDK